MTISGRIYEILNRFNKKRNLSENDLSAEQLQHLIKMKDKVFQAAIDYEKELKSMLNLPDEYVIKWYEGDTFRGYIDYIEEDGTKIPTYTEDIDKVKHEVFSTKEEAERTIKALREADNIINETFEEVPASTYIIEQRF